MTTAQNKVRFGLKNVHYAPYEVTNGEYVFETPKKYPGAVELSLEPKGETSEFYADDEAYYLAESNQGYEGTYTSAEIPEDFRITVLGEEEIDGVLVETTAAKRKPVALLYEFDGDVKATRHVLFNCQFSRPGESGATKEESSEVSTNELSFNASPGPLGPDGKPMVKAKTGSNTTDEVYNNWYKAVFVPGATASTETPQP